MMKKRGYWIGAVILAAAVVFCLFYTRPFTLAQRFPYLDFSQCAEIRGYYSEYPETDNVPVVISRGSAAFDELTGIMQSTKFRTRLINLLPQGTKTHQSKDGDFRWELEFYFDKADLPDGSTVSGVLLSMQDFYGDLSFSADGKITSCTAEEKKEWIGKIRDIIVPEIRGDGP